MIESFAAKSPTQLERLWLPSIRVARKGMIALSIKVAGALVALALQVYLAQTLGPTGYGEYAYVFAWLQLVLIVAQGGFSTAALRYVAQYRARRQPELVQGFLTRSCQITLLESIVGALLMAGCAAALHSSDSTGSVRNFLIASAALPVLAQFMLGNAVVRGLGHVIPSMLVGMAQPLLLLGALLAFAHIIQTDISSSDALLLNLGAAAGALGIVFAMRRYFERDLNPASQRTFHTSEWVSTASQMMLASILMYLQGRTGIIFSGWLLDARDAGMYAAMERLADAALLGLTSVNLLVAPKFASLHAQGRHRELQRYARLAAWGASGFMLAAAVPLVLFGKSILRLFGEEFVAGYPVLLVLLGGAIVNAACGSVGLLLSMTGHHRRLLAILAVGLVINLSLSFLLVPRFDIVGAAWANTMALLFWNLCMVYAVRTHLRIWPNIGRIASNEIF